MRKIKAGGYSFYFNRLQVWMGRMNFLMILYLFVMQSGINPYVAVVGIVVGALSLAFIDSKYVVEDESRESIRRSPPWVKFLSEWNDFYGRNK